MSGGPKKGFSIETWLSFCAIGPVRLQVNSSTLGFTLGRLGSHLAFLHYSATISRRGDAGSGHSKPEKYFLAVLDYYTMPPLKDS